MHTCAICQARSSIEADFQRIPQKSSNLSTNVCFKNRESLMEKITKLPYHSNTDRRMRKGDYCGASSQRCRRNHRLILVSADVISIQQQSCRIRFAHHRRILSHYNNIVSIIYIFFALPNSTITS